MRKITFSEAVVALKEGKRVYLDNNRFYYIEDGFLIYMNTEDNLKIFNNAIYSEDALYLDEPEEFKITGTGLYKTRGGRKAFVSCEISEDFAFAGVIEGTCEICSWKEQGKSDIWSVSDIISKWED